MSGDIDRLMATMVAEPKYHIWGASKSIGPQGYGEVRANYEALVRSGKNRLAYNVTRVVADATCVVTEGEFQLAYPGVVLPVSETVSGQPINAQHWYLVQYKCVVLWPMDDAGLIRGEELYAGEVPRIVTHLQDGQRPDLGPRQRTNGVLVEGWVPGVGAGIGPMDSVVRRTT